MHMPSARLVSAPLPLLVLVASALVGGCSDERLCRLAVEDPSGVAAGAGALVVLIDGVEVSRAQLKTGFPVTQILTRSSAGEIGAVVEAWAGNEPIARASVTLVFAEELKTVTATLGKACAAAVDCDDGIFGNGEETCAEGVCAAGSNPCVAPVACVDVEASEEARVCVITPRHERCEPIETDTGEVITTYCDAINGCLPGEACTEEGAECPRHNPCDGTRTCTSGRCVQTASLAVDDDNPCTLDLCDPAAGVVHLPSPAVEGISCPLDGASAGICLDGGCAASRCGDGFVDREAGEECDDGDAANSDTESNACRTDCTLPACGDEVLDFGEDCDDGNVDPSDACNACVITRCGDGEVRAGVEECDDGNANDNDGCVSDCRVARCGDGHLRFGAEGCDDGNDIDEDGCLSSCVANTCGDGIRNPAVEQCDDGNGSDLDGCLVTCRDNVCGDGKLNAGVEDCDDANTFSQDACLPGCVLNVCGDGVRDFTEEECDDGNTASFDGCSGSCNFIAWELDLGEPIAAGSAPIAWSTVTLDGEGNPLAIDVLGVLTADGSLVALERATGAEVWRFDAADAASAAPVAGRHGVYFVTDAGVVHGLGFAGPAEQHWEVALQAPANGAGLAVSTGPSNDAVLAVDAAARLYHFRANGANGNFAFTNTGSGGNSPDLRTYDALATCDRCTPTAFGDLTPNVPDSENGLPGFAVPMTDAIWGWDLTNHEAPQKLPSAPVLRQVAYRGFYGGFASNLSGFLYFTSTGGDLFGAAFSVSGGGGGVTVNKLFTVSGAAPFATVPTVAVDPGTNSDAIIVADDAGGLARYTRTAPTQAGGNFSFTLSPRWPITLDSPAAAQPALGAGGKLFVADAAGHVHALDDLSGVQFWQLDLGAVASGSPLPIDDGVFVSTTVGRVFALERGTAEAPSTAWARQGRNAAGDGTAPQCGHHASRSSLGWHEGAVLALLITVVAPGRRRRKAAQGPVDRRSA